VGRFKFSYAFKDTQWRGNISKAEIGIQGMVIKGKKKIRNLCKGFQFRGKDQPFSVNIPLRSFSPTALLSMLNIPQIPHMFFYPVIIFKQQQ